MKLSRIVALALAGLLISTGTGSASDAVRCVQGQLEALGYDVGAIDGAFGNRTFQAGEAYREYMSTTYPGWASPPLSERNAEDWCKQVAAAHQKAQRFLTEFLGQGGGVVLTARNLSAPRTIRAGVPYPVELSYSQDGSGEAEIIEACFTWNGEGPYCWEPDAIEAGEVRMELVTGNPNRYTLNGALKYRTGGKILMSNWSSANITVR